MPVNDPWSQFPVVQDDTPRPPAGMPVMPAPVNADPWAAFPLAEAQRSTVKDVAAGGAKGVVRGAVNTPLIPLHLARLVKTGLDAGLDAVAEGAYDYVIDPTVRAVTGRQPATSEELSAREKEREAFKQRRADADIISRGLDYGNAALSRGLDNALGATETPQGRLAETVGEFLIPGQVLGGGSTKTAKLIGDTVVPAVGAWGAGELSDQNPWAKFFGSLAGSTLTGLVREAPATGQQLIKGGVNKDFVTPDKFAAAKALQDEATRRGINLSGQEALDAATNAGTSLGNLARVVETSQPGGAVARPFFSARPSQIDSAITQSIDNIAPPSQAANMIAPKIKDAAEKTISDRVSQINAGTRPLYEAAEPQLTGIDTSAPAFQVTLKQLRDNPVLAPEFSGYADDSVKVVDAVTKLMTAKAKSLDTPANPSGMDPLASAIFSSSSGAARGAARQAVPEYDAALTAQQLGRTMDVAPLEAGPVGRVANVKTPSTSEVASAFLPKSPDVQRVLPSRTAFERAQLARQDQGSYDQFMRQVLDNARNTAAAERGSSQIGRKFVDDVAGNAAQRADLMEALGATSKNADAVKDIGDLLDVLNATRYRPNSNSMTQNNADIKQMAQGAPTVSRLLNFTANPTNWAQPTNDMFRQFWYGRNLRDAADILYGPNSVQRIEDIVMGRVLSSNPDSLLANTAQRAKQAIGPAILAGQGFVKPNEEQPPQ